MLTCMYIYIYMYTHTCMSRPCEEKVDAHPLHLQLDDRGEPGRRADYSYQYCYYHYQLLLLL